MWFAKRHNVPGRICVQISYLDHFPRNRMGVSRQAAILTCGEGGNVGLMLFGLNSISTVKQKWLSREIQFNLNTECKLHQNQKVLWLYFTKKKKLRYFINYLLGAGWEISRKSWKLLGEIGDVHFFPLCWRYMLTLRLRFTPGRWQHRSKQALQSSYNLR